VALEELRKAVIKRQDSMHIFVVPRLLKPEWLKQTFEASDVVFQVPIGCPFWPQKMFEPLTIGLCFPFISSPPWQLRGTLKMLAVVRQMRRVFKEESLVAGSVFCKLLLVRRRIRTMPENVVRRLLRFESRDKLSRTATVQRGGRKRERRKGLGETDKALRVKEEVPIGFPRRKKW
jgi:hypothetical protein